MQVRASLGTQGTYLASTSYGFGIMSLILAAVTGGVVVITWLILFGFHLVTAFGNNRRVMELVEEPNQHH
jgi:hypothetical protein